MSCCNTKVRAIVFDFGGVLLDWNPRYLYRKLFHGDESAMESFLERINFADWNRQQDLGRPFAVGVAELIARFPNYAGLIRAYDERWIESIAGPIQRTVDFLEPLKQAGYELHGLSNFSQEKFAIVQAQYHFFDLLATILISSVVKLSKPDPQIFALLLQRCGRAAQECLFIDDAEPNIVTARCLGFQTIHFTAADQLGEALQRLGLLKLGTK